VGNLYRGGEAWFVPRYTAERLPELKSAADLPKFKEKFADPEEPSKGRFYSCPAGWACEVTTANLFHALGLQDTFSLYSPGTGAAQKAALMSAYQRKQDVVFYYWYPTPLVGALDLVKLEMPPYDAQKYACLTLSKCADPQASDYPENPIATGVNTTFAQQAPQLIEFLSKVAIPLPIVNETLAHMEESSEDSAQVAQWFLKNKSDVWTQWVPAEVASRVQAAL
jgi:glycine betaine/proline transport system substrate-binding protein